MQKNKIDVVKAVCNSAAKKLAALSLAATVGCGAVASAQISEDEANHQHQRLQMFVLTITPQERLRRLEIKRSDKIKQEGDIKRQIIETEQRKKNIQYLLTPPYPKDVIGAILRDDGAWFQAYQADLASLERELLLLNEALENQILAISLLDVQIEDLRAQIEGERQEAPAEEIVEIVPGDEEMKEESDELQRRNRTPERQIVRLQNGTVFALGETAQDTLKNLIRAMRPRMLDQMIKETLGQK